MKYDLIIIGGGPAGLTAGIYAKRELLNTILIEKLACGGQITLTEFIENYPGFPEGLSGRDLATKMENQAKRLGLEILYDEVLEVSIKNDQKIVKTSKEQFESKILIIATGASAQKLNISGEKEFIGRGISYCAICDAPFFKDKEVAVVGGGDTAVSEAIYLTKFCKKVYLIHRRDKLRAFPIIVKNAQENSKIEFVLNSIVEKINGQTQVENIEIKNLVSGEKKSLLVSGVFVLIGTQPNTSFIKDLVNQDEQGYILTSENMETNIPGIFAAGDCRKKLLRQVSTAVSDGATAAFSALKYLQG